MCITSLICVHHVKWKMILFRNISYESLSVENENKEGMPILTEAPLTGMYSELADML